MRSCLCELPVSLATAVPCMHAFCVWSARLPYVYVLIFAWFPIHVFVDFVHLQKFMPAKL